MKNKHEFFMNLAIKEAKKGIGKVNPNPLVGAILVKNNKIISKGYHEYWGGRHAEVVAIENAKKRGGDIKGATMYVTLEPCSHYGKTPPCADRIVKEGIKNVYIGLLDPNPLVSGKGIEILKKNGVGVYLGILEHKIKELNEIYLKYITKKMPFVALKFALTIDGFIATKQYETKWISNEKSRKFTHYLRTYYSSILIGSNTLLLDNPRLTARIKKGRNPIRIILDRSGKSQDKKLNIFFEQGKNIIFTKANYSMDFPNTEIIKETDIHEILKILWEKGIDSILIEGGSKVASLFIENELVDKLHIFYAPKIFGQGISPFEGIEIKNIKDEVKFKPIKMKKFDDNIYWELKRCFPE